MYIVIITVKDVHRIIIKLELIFKKETVDFSTIFFFKNTGALGRPRGMGGGGRLEVGLGWGTHVNPWLIHVNIWQKPLQYCKVISFQLIKINLKKNIVYVAIAFSVL